MKAQLKRRATVAAAALPQSGMMSGEDVQSLFLALAFVHEKDEEDIVVVLGIHGGALANSLFLSPGQGLVEITPQQHSCGHPSMFAHVTVAVGARYRGVLRRRMLRDRSLRRRDRRRDRLPRGS